MTVIVITVDGAWLVKALFMVMALAGSLVQLRLKHGMTGPLMVAGGAAGVLGVDAATGAPWWWYALPGAIIALVFLREGLAQLGRRSAREASGNSSGVNG